ncbi:glycosyltransferase [Neoasaia chiangmaiensis]|nr:glycosyltransferase [Neoasaia chiangmaiensis]
MSESGAARRWLPRMVRGTEEQGGRVGQPVAILLSVYNGEAFLNDQLDSIVAQTDPNWVVYWRDDGSDDASRAIMLSFQAHRGAGRCVEITSHPGRLGIADSYMALLAGVPVGACVAFADQDDVWRAEKLAWAMATMGTGAAGERPILYCGRQYLTDAALKVRAESAVFRRAPGFAAALTQNIATGHTIVLNAAAVALLRDFGPPAGVLHDWWAYLVVTAAGGRVAADPRCVSYYRQHSGNTVGAHPSWMWRGWAALRRGPNMFMAIFDANVVRLSARPERLDATARAILSDLRACLSQGVRARWRVLRRWRGLVRQTPSETLVFRLWFLLSSRR